MCGAISQAHPRTAAAPKEADEAVSALLGSPDMADTPPTLDELAKRYLDLWQDQIAAMAADPDMAHAMGRYAQLFATVGPAGFAGIWAAAADGLKGNGTGGAFADFFNQPAPPAGGPAPAGAAHGDRGDELAELRRRLAVLEARGAAPPASSVAPKPARARKPARKRAPEAS